MEIYKRKSWWKISLAIVGLIIAMITMLYANYLAGKLAEVEENNVTLYVMAIKESNKVVNQNLDNPDSDVSLQIELLQTIQNIPVILEGEDGYLIGYNFFDEEEITDQAFLTKEKEAILKKGFSPIEGGSGYASKVYYKNSRLYTLITYFPFVQILLLGSFIAVGYFGLNASRRAEQNRVWAGMAKETAHQLGTPISAILAWIEILKDRAQDEEDTEIVEELTKDVHRLELVADRFSKIGSTPTLEATSLNEELEKCTQYMARRKPQKVGLVFHPTLQNTTVNINRHLFDWVIENIVRNALDALDGKGDIILSASEDEKFAIIDISDSGSGIPANKYKTIFEPGYSTKKRGWGLGLSLAKRIIESYHKGKIFVKNSTINEGTTFTIKIPKA
jgi:signal transduction histidine kinase